MWIPAHFCESGVFLSIEFLTASEVTESHRHDSWSLPLRIKTTFNIIEQAVASFDAEATVCC